MECLDGSLFGKHSDLMFTTLDSFFERSGFYTRPGSLGHVLEHGTLLSHCLHLPKLCMGTEILTYMQRVPYDKLACRLVGKVEIQPQYPGPSLNKPELTCHSGLYVDRLEYESVVCILSLGLTGSMAPSSHRRSTFNACRHRLAV